MSRVYVGNLDPRISERDLEDEFRIYGVLRSVWVARRPPGYAFIEFDDRRDALDAIHELDGVTALVENLLEVAAYLLVGDATTAGHLPTAGAATSHLMPKVYHLAVAVVATAGPQHIVVMILLTGMELDAGLSKKYY